MVAVLPLLLYPILGFVVLRFALGVVDRPSVIGIARSVSGKTGDFPEPAVLDLAPRYLAWLALTPALSYPDRVAGVMALSAAADRQPGPFLSIDKGKVVLLAGQKPPSLADPLTLIVHGKPSLELALLAQAVDKTQFEFLDPQAALEALEEKRLDLLISARGDFYANLKKTESQDVESQAVVKIQSRAGPERYRIAKSRLDLMLDYWKKDVNNQRLRDHDLPSHFDQPFVTDEGEVPPATSGSNQERILELMVRIFPFMLVMWSLAGALYPAVDLCAGEKERGTMETLLISPAGREEIVLGKFLTIWVFSAGTALLNLISMGLTTWQFAKQSAAWVVAAGQPALVRGAAAAAVGVLQRHQPGDRRLCPQLQGRAVLSDAAVPDHDAADLPDAGPRRGAEPVLQPGAGDRGRPADAETDDGDVARPRFPGSTSSRCWPRSSLYSCLALRWAIEQFQREEVLFREAERLDLILWLRRLFRDKEATPTTGQAFFCFAPGAGAALAVAELRQAAADRARTRPFGCWRSSPRRRC